MKTSRYAMVTALTDAHIDDHYSSTASQLIFALLAAFLVSLYCFAPGTEEQV